MIRNLNGLRLIAPLPEWDDVAVGVRIRRAPTRLPATISLTRSGTMTVVTVSSPLPGTVYYYWYLDGAYIGVTTSPSRSFVLNPGDQSRIDVLDSSDPNFDFVGNAPAGYSARRTLVWVRSIDPDIDRYRVEQQRAGGAWTVLGYVQDDAARWNFEFLTAHLDDLTQYAWRVVPINTIGNDGMPIALAAELIVRTPDAPNFSATLQTPSTFVLFGAA